MLDREAKVIENITGMKAAREKCVAIRSLIAERSQEIILEFLLLFYTNITILFHIGLGGI